MLKFSGYPYLIRGQSLKDGGFYGRAAGDTSKAKDSTALEVSLDRH